MTWKWENSHKSIAIGKIVSRMYSFQQGRILTVGLSTFVYCASLCLITCLLRTADGFITADNWRVDGHVTCGWRGCNYPLPRATSLAMSPTLCYYSGVQAPVFAHSLALRQWDNYLLSGKLEWDNFLSLTCGREDWNCHVT